MQKLGTVVLGVTGGIAAYKSCEVVSRLKKAGAEVYVVMSKNATQFVSALTFETLSGHAVAVDTFSHDAPYEVEHIALAKRADVFLIAPATANILAKMACGIADDMLSTTVLATKAPIVLAPAMNENMWQNAITQENLQTLQARGMQTVGPAKGHLACNDEGVGRMAEPVEIVESVLKILRGNQDLAGKRILVSAGPTQEAMDAVRYLTNRSSGKMGLCLAAEAKRRGAEVLLVHGPLQETPEGLEHIAVRSTQEMLNALQAHFRECDALIMAAAPCDFCAAEYQSQKIKKQEGVEEITLRLKKTPDILETLALQKENQILVGFAAETQDVEAYAREKLIRKKLDMIVANDVSSPDAGFDVDTNRVVILKASGERVALPLASKQEIARGILNEMLSLI